MNDQPTKKIIIGSFSRKLLKNPLAKQHLNSNRVIFKPKDSDAHEIDLLIGWGKRDKALKASSFAKRNNLPYATLEDGFIHSMSQGRLGASSWSLVVDKVGIYYDASSPSSLENFIRSNTLSVAQKTRALNNIKSITDNCITKYNNAKLIVPDSVIQLKKTVLVIDQVNGDMSVPYALANSSTFDEMLNAAILENPDADILIKTHPDVINGRKKGCITIPKTPTSKFHVISDNINPLALLKHVEKVYVVSSQMGFEALLMNRAVICFGAPFYSGWGLTEDRLLSKDLEVFKRRQKQTDLASIFFAAYHQYSNYVHPDTQQPCDLEDIIEYIKLQYANQKKFTGKIFCIGLTPWKKAFVRSFLKTPDNTVIFAKNASDAKKHGFDKSSKACLWSFRNENEAQKLKDEFQTPVWRLEDGFIRSVSLGSDYALPSSLVVDKQGLYFNPQEPSDLETILLETNFSAKQLQAAERIRYQIIKQAISKYNTGSRGTNLLINTSSKRKIILIPGQVSNDESIIKGCKDISNNTDLIRAVRKEHPSAYIIYKPHPDVLSGNRDGTVKPEYLKEYCDQVITDISIPDCLKQVDEVHTMTSLVGFEALLRGLEVYCYGIPFYSGWGLTIDRHPCSRRTRQLSKNQLIAGTLLCYPLYLNWETKKFTNATHVANTIHSHLSRPEAKGRKTYTSTVLKYPAKFFNLFKVTLLLKAK